MIDFTQDAFRYRLAHCQGRNELIAKAVGYQGAPLKIFDTTAGLGKEAFLLASLGCEVTLFERHPRVAEELEIALQQAKQSPELAAIVARMTLRKQCAIDFFQTTPTIEKPDVVYCDPMFLPRSKSAAVKKNIRQLQEWVGQDNDADRLVSLARHYARKRVVVKCALHTGLLHPHPIHSFKARSHRFDIYVPLTSDNMPM